MATVAEVHAGKRWRKGLQVAVFVTLSLTRVGSLQQVKLKLLSKKKSIFSKNAILKSLTF